MHPMGKFNINEEISYYRKYSTPVSGEELRSLETDLKLWVPDLPDLFFHKRILDIGAGRAPMGILIANKYNPEMVVSLELSWMRIHSGVRWMSKLNSLALVCGDVFHLPYEDGTFDLVIANSVLHHLPNLSEVTREISRVLNPGGMYIGREPNFNNPIIRWVVFPPISSLAFYHIHHSPNEYPLRAEEIIDAFTAANCKCKMHYFWRRLPGLRHNILSAAISVRANRIV